jgi:uncharacterized protein (TIGR03000 family)
MVADPAAVGTARGRWQGHEKGEASMRRSPTLSVLALVGLTLLGQTALLRGQESTSQPAFLVVYVPAAARVTVDGTATKSTGTIRRYESPALPAGKNYVYTFRATWTEDGKEVTVEKTTHVRAGQEVTIDLRSAEKKEGKAARNLDRTPDVVYWPTPQNVVDKMLELAEVKKGDVIYDLGCGDARILVTAAKKYGVKGLGVDIDPDRIKDSLENVKKNKVEDLVTIKRQDIFEMDLTGANVITLYLLPSLNVKLMPQLEKLKPGSRIVSHDFDMKGAKPKKVVKVRAVNHFGDAGEHTIYLWVVPWEKE